MFVCEKCGSCCAVVNCCYLGADNLCEIYEKRPYVCRVDGPIMDGTVKNIAAWYAANKAACGELRLRRAVDAVGRSTILDIYLPTDTGLSSDCVRAVCARARDEK